MRKGNPVPVLALATSCIRPCCSLPYLKVKFPDVQYRRTSPFSPPPPPACQSHLLLLLSPPSGSPSIRHCSGRKRRSRRRSRRILGDGERDGVKKNKKKTQSERRQKRSGKARPKPPEHSKPSRRVFPSVSPTQVSAARRLPLLLYVLSFPFTSPGFLHSTCKMVRKRLLLHFFYRW